MVYTKQFPQNLLRTPTTTSSLGSGSYTVLPPIGKPMTGKEPEQSPGQSVNTAYPINRSSSDGYLVQMEKQKQLRARVTYKVCVSVSFICVLKGGMLKVHTFYLCCRTVIFVSHQCFIICIIYCMHVCRLIWEKTPSEILFEMLAFLNCV